MRSLFFSLALVLLSATSFAQGEENSLKGVPIKERIVTGGGFGLGFTNAQDFISISPSIGYALTRKFLVGTGVSYQYNKFKNVYQGKSVVVNNYGINPFARFMVYQGFFIQTEFEHLRYQGILVPSLEKTNNSFNSFMAGGGLLQPIGNKASFFAMALYNFSFRNPQPGEFLPYNSPWVVRAGFNLGGFIF
jgi:hypothetical protein